MSITNGNPMAGDKVLQVSANAVYRIANTTASVGLNLVCDQYLVSHNGYSMPRPALSKACQ